MKNASKRLSVYVLMNAEILCFKIDTDLDKFYFIVLIIIPDMTDFG